jgi:hypothetical protein
MDWFGAGLVLVLARGEYEYTVHGPAGKILQVEIRSETGR